MPGAKALSLPNLVAWLDPASPLGLEVEALRVAHEKQFKNLDAFRCV